MTHEQLDALENLLQHATTEAPEVLDAIRSSIAQARRALELEEELDAARAQGRREGRREGLEEAAQVADGHAEHGEFWHAGRYDCAEYIALDIRARINQEPTA